MISFLQHIALWPAELIVRLILMLFNVELEYMPYEWRVISVGFIAFFFWAHVIKITLTLVLRKVFGYYGSKEA